MKSIHLPLLHPLQIESLWHTSYESDLFHGRMNEYHGNVILFFRWEGSNFPNDSVIPADDGLIEEYIDFLSDECADKKDLRFHFYFFENKIEAMIFQNMQNYHYEHISFLIHDAEAISEDMEYFVVCFSKGFQDNMSWIDVEHFEKYVDSKEENKNA